MKPPALDQISNLLIRCLPAGQDRGSRQEAKIAYRLILRYVAADLLDVKALRVVSASQADGGQLYLDASEREINKLRKHCDYYEDRISELERVIETLRTTPPPIRDRKPAGRQDYQRADNNYLWTAQNYQRGIDILLDPQREARSKKRAVCETIGISSGQFDGKFRNSPPDEALLQAEIAVFEDDRPTTFLELWKIGTRLHADRWRGEFESQFGLARRSIGFAVPPLTAGQIVQVRTAYANVRMRKFSRIAYGVLALVKNAGRDGLTKPELAAHGPEGEADLMKNWLRTRCEELVFANAIFDSGMVRGGYPVYVSQDCRNAYPAAFKHAQDSVRRASGSSPARARS